MRSKYTQIVILGLCFLSTELKAATLPEVARYALKHNPQILASSANRQSNDFALQRAVGGFLPHMDMHLSSGPEFNDNIYVRDALNLPNNQLHRQENAINMTQLLFDGGRVQSEVKQQTYNLMAADYQFTQNTQEILMQAIESYLNVLRARELILLSQNNIRSHQKILRFIEMRYQGGAGTIGEIQLAKTRLALAEIRLNNSVGYAKNIYARYLAVVGQSVPKNLKIPNPIDDFLPERLSLAVKMALNDNPNLRTSAAQIGSSLEQENAEKTRWIPRFNLELRATDNDNLDGVPGLNRDFAALVTVDYNLFNGGSDVAAINQARSKTVESRENYNQTKRETIEKLAATWADLQTNIKEYGRQRSYVTYAKDVVEDYIIQFKLGKRALFNILDAENELFSARVGLANAYYDAKLDSYRVLLNMGHLNLSVLS